MPGDGHGEIAEAARIDAARREVVELADATDVGELWNTTVDRFGEYLHSGFDLDPSTQIAARIEVALKEGRPASFVRLGDGEGNVLATTLGSGPALAEYCLRHTSLRHFGAPSLLTSAGAELAAAFAAVLRNADLVGFPGPYGTAILLDRAADDAFADARRWPSFQGVVSTQRYLNEFAEDLDLGSRTGTSSGFNLGLHSHYEGLISGRDVGLISCHTELPGAVEAGLGATAVELRLVPGQARYSDDPHADTGYWPRRHRELLHDLAKIEPGTLWLIAAGLPGKVYCEVIRAAGGVALDIGHVADLWLGRRTRFTTDDDDLNRWRLL